MPPRSPERDQQLRVILRAYYMKVRGLYKDFPHGSSKARILGNQQAEDEAVAAILSVTRPPSKVAP